MDLIISIVVIVFGSVVLYVTYKDGEKRNAEFSVDYIMHLKGYLGGFVFFIIGLIMLFKNL